MRRGCGCVACEKDNFFDKNSIAGIAHHMMRGHFRATNEVVLGRQTARCSNASSRAARAASSSGAIEGADPQGRLGLFAKVWDRT